MQLLKFCTISELVDTVFSNPPQKAYSYPLLISVPQDVDHRVYTFPYLMSILIHGAKKLFGESVSPQTITTDQFSTLKAYMLSLGYLLKTRYSYSQDNELIVNIWFEKYKPIVNCKGVVLY